MAGQKPPVGKQRKAVPDTMPTGAAAPSLMGTEALTPKQAAEARVDGAKTLGRMLDACDEANYGRFAADIARNWTVELEITPFPDGDTVGAQMVKTLQRGLLSDKPESIRAASATSLMAIADRITAFEGGKDLTPEQRRANNTLGAMVAQSAGITETIFKKSIAEHLQMLINGPKVTKEKKTVTDRHGQPREEEVLVSDYARVRRAVGYFEGSIGTWDRIEGMKIGIDDRLQVDVTGENKIIGVAVAFYLTDILRNKFSMNIDVPDPLVYGAAALLTMIHDRSKRDDVKGLIEEQVGRTGWVTQASELNPQMHRTKPLRITLEKAAAVSDVASQVDKGLLEQIEARGVGGEDVELSTAGARSDVSSPEWLKWRKTAIEAAKSGRGIPRPPGMKDDVPPEEWQEWQDTATMYVRAGRDLPSIPSEYMLTAVESEQKMARELGEQMVDLGEELVETTRRDKRGLKRPGAQDELEETQAELRAARERLEERPVEGEGEGESPAQRPTARQRPTEGEDGRRTISREDLPTPPKKKGRWWLLGR